LKALFNELRRLGYVEGDNLLIERYSGEGRAAHYPELVRDVVSRNPDLIIAITTGVTLDLKVATTTIPIVGMFAYPVESGIVPSLARPGGNITGVADDVGLEQWGKRIQLLRQLVPHLTKVAVLETRPYQEGWANIRSELGRRWGVPYADPTPLDLPINEAEYRRVFASVAQTGAAGMVVTDETVNIANLKVIVELSEKNRLPVVYPFKIVRPSRRPHILRGRRGRIRPEHSRHGRPNSERCQTGRHPNLPADQIRVGYQSQDGESTRPHRAS
jgi:putative tryptophan/tyrosine transport system substrate-binding protein